jgi:hypothetical protein
MLDHGLRRSQFLLLLAVALGAELTGCAPPPDAGNTGGRAGTGGAGTGGAGAGGAGAGGRTGVGGSGVGGTNPDAGMLPTAATCPESAAPLRTTGSIVDFPIEIALGGKPLVFGESNLLGAGGTITLLDVRFYVSSATLMRGDQTAVPVDIVTASGSPEPYGIHFFNADDVSSRTMRVLAPAGNYTGISFQWGLTQTCNQGNPSQLKAPLSDTSQMTWPHLFGGYLFFKYGGLVLPGQGDAGTASPLPGLIHMGGSLTMDAAPVIRINGTLTVPAGGTVSRTIQVVMDEVFRGAAMNVDLADVFIPPGADEVVLGERLRRSTAGLKIFVFGP